MIEVKTLEAVEYSPLDVTALAVIPRPNTPFNELVNLLTVDGVLDDKSTEPPTASEIAAYVATIPEHTELLAELKNNGLTAVRQLSVLVKNTINPHICKVVDEIKRTQAEESSTPSWTIAPVCLPPLLSTGFATTFLANAIRPAIQSGTVVGVGKVPTDQIATLALATDAEGYNDRVKVLLSDPMVLDYLSSCIEKGKCPLTLPSGDNLDRELCYLMACIVNNIKTPPEGVAMTLGQWELAKVRLIHSCAVEAQAAIAQYERAISQGLLYVNPPLKKPGVIELNAKVYRDMVDKGLTPEVVIGNELSGRKFMSFQLLKEDVARLCTHQYNLDRNARLEATRLENRAYRNKTIQTALKNDFNHIADVDAWPVAGDTREKAWQRLRSVCEKILSGPYKEFPIEDIVAAILLTTWYAHTGAWRLLDIASRIAKSDPELSSDEVFSLAKIEYVGLWLSSLMEVVKVTPKDDLEVVSVSEESEAG